VIELAAGIVHWIAQVLKTRVSDRSYAIGLTLIFLCGGAVAASHHEMARDELQAWLLARDSSSLINLLRNIKYEGHPSIWYICLMFLNKVTDSPVIMQLFHLLIITATIYILALYSPFTRLQRLLLAFGYFFFYEYSVVCRSYALGILLFFLFCLLYQQRYTRFPLITAILFLLGHATVLTLILSISAGLALFADYLSYREQIQANDMAARRSIYIGFGLIALGWITSILQLNPPADSGYAIGWVTSYQGDRLKMVLMQIPRAFFAVPGARYNFWQTWLFDRYLIGKILFALSFLLIICFLLVLLCRPAILLLYTLGVLGLLSFFYIKHFGGVYHTGFLFILFIGAAWVYRYAKEVEIPAIFMYSHSIVEKLLSPTITFILIFHFIGGIIAVIMDYRYDFSYGKKAAAFIEEQGMKDKIMIAERDYAATSVIGYLKKDKVYFPRGDRFGSFVRWDIARTKNISDMDIILKANQLKDKYQQDILVIMNHKLDRELISSNFPAELTEFSGSIVNDEDFYLYLVNK
jgi:hypothetical protein